MAENGIITIPSRYFEDAITNHARLQLVVDELEQPYIIFLPVIESEPFPHDGTALGQQGDLQGGSTNQYYKTTDFINIDFVDDIIMKGYLQRTNIRAMWAYDSNYQPVKVLIKTIAENEAVHVQPDGTYAYIRACSAWIRNDNPIDYSLQLHYRSRRPRPTNNDSDDSR